MAAVAAAVLLPGLSANVWAQDISDRISFKGERAFTWSRETENIVLVEGPVTIETDTATLTADRAVAWLRPEGTAGRLNVDLVLLGDAALKQGEIERRGRDIRVSLAVRGRVLITAASRLASDRSDTDDFRAALMVREQATAVAALPAPSDPRVPFASPRADRPPTVQRFDFTFDNLQTVKTDDGTIAALLTGGITIIQRRATGDLVELRAARAVLFTTLTDLADAANLEPGSNEQEAIRQAVTSAYLEGDVRINFTPAVASVGEQQLSAERVFYEFTTDRAVLTDAVLHTIDPVRQIPVTVRAQQIKQLAAGQWKADDAQLSTSTFAVPGYSLRTSRVAVKQQDGGPAVGMQTTFDARNVRFELEGVPFFWLPVASGSVTERGFPLRGIFIENSSTFGTAIRTEWGLLDALGVTGPANLDLTLKLDYLSNRGPAIGIDGTYRDSYITQHNREPWSFLGEFESYLVLDDGPDRLGRDRANIPHDSDLRGRITWRHQHFLPDYWQLQARSSWISDGTFLEEWYEREFDSGLPNDTSIYLKRQQNTEALTLLVQFQPNSIVTTADSLQEFSPLVDPTLGVANQSPFEIEKLPEIGYRRIGDTFGSDRLTFYSQNTLGGMRFNESRDTLGELGFRNRRFERDENGNFIIDPITGQRVLRSAVLPGYPAAGYTGVTSDWVARGDFRQQVDLPFNAGPIRMVPYVFGRYTFYGDSPDDGWENRLMGGVGLRASTSIWRIYDDVRSDILDINRVRHIIEPEMHLFASAATRDRSDVYIYEQDVDGISDISAISFGVRQRFQTKRGGPGRERSVDFLTLNLRATFFGNEPDEVTILDADSNPFTANAFRGVFFDSMPEASIARDHLAADAVWRLSDTTAIVADANYNLDTGTLATASLGLAAQRGERLSYYVGARYVGEVNSTLLNLSAVYDVTSKYSVAFSQAFDMSERSSQSTTVTLVRRFDRYMLAVSFYLDQLDDEGGIRIAFIPEGLGFGFSTYQYDNAFGR
jgi:hypothetical protein